ncbi:MAG: aminotransferase class I/II-fold pyridoxal phosphate-dependent enzyme [Planctomycetia bacterium]|nr:aminotransferase class I/II-fold pyridoxal phosphate-dependent enzyme [Planctomycetia bacterium]
MLRHRAAHKGGDTAFVYLVDGETDEVAITYAELDRQARAIAAWLQAHGLQGQRALLLYPSGLDFIASFFGCLYAGVVAVPAYPPRMNRSLGRIQAIAADCDARVALTTAAVWERVQPLLEQTRHLSNVRWRATDEPHGGIESAWEYPDVGPGTLAFLQYTSGSTGKPKGVTLTHGNLMHNSALIDHLFEQSQRTGMGVFWLPSYHDMGLIGGILQPIYISRPNVLISPVAFLQRPLRWLQAISRYKATISGGPNFAYDLCVRKITPEQREGLDLSRWTLAFNGAEPIRAETIDRFCEAFSPCGFKRESLYPCYGLAEATLIVSGGYKEMPPVVRSFQHAGLESGEAVSAGDGGGRRLVGSGESLPDQQIAIVDPETLSCLPNRRIGEVWVKGPSVAQGYWNRPEETEQVFRAHLADSGEGPFLRTGDLGFLDHGELFITGRLKDLIIVRGLNHYPQDIEATAEKAHPGVRQGSSAAFTVEDDEATRLAVVCEMERSYRGDIAAILDAVRREVAREHELVVDAVVLVKSGSVPKTSSGKIQRHACRTAFVAGTFDVVARYDAATSDGHRPSDPAAANGHRPKRAAKVLRNGTSSESTRHRRSEQVSAKAANGAPATPSTPDATGQLNGSHDSGANGNGHATTSKRPQSTAISKVDAVLEEVRRIAKERAADLTLDSSITDLGLDSLERMEILASLEERFGGRFPEDVMPELETCRQVLEAVETYLGSGHKKERAATKLVPTENYHFDEIPEYVKLKQSLDLLEESGLANPFFHLHEQVAADTTVVGGRELINFSGFNYIGMSGDPTVAQAAKDAVDQYGTSVSASRLVSGNKVVHRELELAIAEWIGAQDSIVFVGGHATNETTVGHLFGPGDLVLHDALAHNSIVQGCILSGARRRPFPHNDWRAVDRLLTDLRGDYRRVLVAIEGVYSMDGDIPDLPRFIEVKKRHKAFLMVDEAHSVGVLGRRGRGIGEFYDVHPSDVDLWMGTLSKAFGSCGGYIAGCKEVVEYLKYTAPGFVFSVGITPSNAAAALAALRLLEEEPQRVEILRERSRLFLELAKSHGINTGASKDSPVVPVILGNSLHCLELSGALESRGINVQPILHPAVEEKAARLRFFITSTHSEEQIRYTVEALAEELAKLDGSYLNRRRQAARQASLEGAST